MTTPTTGDVPNDGTFRHERLLSHGPKEVFDAFARPDVLARWWGPDGFMTTFEAFEFAPGARWMFVMHGPDGTHHPNECVVAELDAPSRLVIDHVSAPRYLLTVTLAPSDGGTRIMWDQAFEDAAVAGRIKHIVEPANEQNLDRLEAVLAGG